MDIVDHFGCDVRDHRVDVVAHWGRTVRHGGLVRLAVFPDIQLHARRIDTHIVRDGKIEMLAGKAQRDVGVIVNDRRFSVPGFISKGAKEVFIIRFVDREILPVFIPLVQHIVRAAWYIIAVGKPNMTSPVVARAAVDDYDVAAPDLLKIPYQNKLVARVGFPGPID